MVDDTNDQHHDPITYLLMFIEDNMVPYQTFIFLLEVVNENAANART